MLAARGQYAADGHGRLIACGPSPTGAPRNASAVPRGGEVRGAHCDGLVSSGCVVSVAVTSGEAMHVGYACPVL